MVLSVLFLCDKVLRILSELRPRMPKLPPRKEGPQGQSLSMKFGQPQLVLIMCCWPKDARRQRKRHRELEIKSTQNGLQKMQKPQSAVRLLLASVLFMHTHDANCNDFVCTKGRSKTAKATESA